jgi:hypothetical protein
LPQPERTPVKNHPIFIIIVQFHRDLQILSPVVKTVEKGTERYKPRTLKTSQIMKKHLHISFTFLLIISLENFFAPFLQA